MRNILLYILLIMSMITGIKNSYANTDYIISSDTVYSCDPSTGIGTLYLQF